MKTKRTEGESCLNFRRRKRRSSVFGEMRRSSHFSASMPATSCSLMRHHQLTSLPIGYTHKEQLYILSHLVSQVKSGQLASGTERKLLRLFLITFLKKWQKKWFPVPGFIGFVIWIAGFFIQDCVLFLSKRNLITRYPVIFNFRVGTGRVLEKKFGTGRVPGSRQTLTVTPLYANPVELFSFTI